MAVTIDDLQVETQSANPAPNAPDATNASPERKPDLKMELERMRERELRLRAD